MKKFLIIIPILLFFLISCNNKQSETPNSKSTKNEKTENNSTFPVFGFKDLKKLLTENPKKIILLNFWATWCGSCREEMPDLIQFYDEYKNKVILIGLSLDESIENVKDFIKLSKINFPVYLADKQLVQHLMVQTIPVTFIFKNGKFIDMHIGPYYYADLKRDINSLENNEKL